MVLQDGQKPVTCSGDQRPAPPGAAAPPLRGLGNVPRLTGSLQNRFCRAGWRAMPHALVWYVLTQRGAFQISQAIQQDGPTVSGVGGRV